MSRASFSRLCLAATALTTTAANAQLADWVQTSGPTGGFIAAIAGGHTDVYAATSHGTIFHSSDAGLSWRDVTANLPGNVVESMARAGDAVFIGTRGGGLWRLDTPGEQWTNVSAGLGNQVILSQTFHNGRLYAASGLQSIGVTDDLGQSWQHIAGPEPFLVLASDGSTLYAGGLIGVYRSDDNGQTWEVRQTGFDISVSRVVSVGPAMFATSGTHLYRSIDSGLSWHIADQTLPSTASAGVLGGVGSTPLLAVHNAPGFDIFHSLDLGQTWRPSQGGFPSGNEGFVQSIGTVGDTALAGSVLTILRSSDAGLTWARSATNLVGTNIRHLSAADGLLVASPWNSPRVAHTTDGGHTWNQDATGIPDEAQLHGVLAIDANTILAGTHSDGIYRSTDGGATYHVLNSGVPRYNGTAGLQFREIECFTTHGGRIFAGTGFGTEFFNQRFNLSGAGPLRLSTSGNAWERVTTGFPIIAFNSFFEPVFDPISILGDMDSVLLAATAFSGVIGTTNLGASWAAGNTGLPQNSLGHFPVMAAFAQVDGVIFAAATGFTFGGAGGTGIFKSTDLGQSWVRADAGLPAERAVQGLAPVGNRLYAGVGNGISHVPDDGAYLSDNLGSTWTRAGSALNGITCGPIAVVNEVPFVHVAARGVWRIDQPCYPDCDSQTGPGVLDIFDFLCFGNRFHAGDPYACDCDTSTGPGVCDIFDFLCFGNAFSAGCP